MTERKEVTLEEVMQGRQKDGTNIDMSTVQAHGVCVIKDKDGNIKSTFEASTDNMQEVNDNET